MFYLYFIQLLTLILCNEIDDAKSPYTFYKLEPEKRGKLIILSGPPASGKSTTAKQLAKDYGYKWYEGDCFLWEGTRNPYLPLDNEENILARKKQRKMRVTF